MEGIQESLGNGNDADASPKITRKSLHLLSKNRTAWIFTSVNVAFWIDIPKSSTLIFIFHVCLELTHQALHANDTITSLDIHQLTF